MSTGIRSETILSYGIRSEKLNNLIFIPSLKNSFKHKADVGSSVGSNIQNNKIWESENGITS